MRELQGAMAAVAAGDRSAFDDVFRALWPRCRAFARKLLDDDALADDAAQQALVQLFAQAPRFDPKRSAVGWALTLTLFQARTARKRRARRRDAGVPDDVRAPSRSPEDHAVRADAVAAALDVVDGLSPLDRSEVLRALDDHDSGDAAARKRRQRAFERLRAAWRARHG